VDKAFEFVHVVFEVLFALWVFPILDGLRTQSENFIDSSQLIERVEDMHFGNVSEIFLSCIIIWIFDGDIDDKILIFDFLEFNGGLFGLDVLNGDFC
jgi:hypothetical protein